MLKKNKTLKWLNLAGTNGSESGCECIGDSLAINTTLRVLNLCIYIVEIKIDECNIGENGCKCISKGLVKNIALKKIYMGKNKIGSDGVVYISEVIDKNKSLKKIEMCKPIFSLLIF